MFHKECFAHRAQPLANGVYLEDVFQKRACGEQWEKVINTVSLTSPTHKETPKQTKKPQSTGEIFLKFLFWRLVSFHILNIN